MIDLVNVYMYIFQTASSNIRELLETYTVSDYLNRNTHAYHVYIKVYGFNECLCEHSRNLLLF